MGMGEGAEEIERGYIYQGKGYQKCSLREY